MRKRPLLTLGSVAMVGGSLALGLALRHDAAADVWLSGVGPEHPAAAPGHPGARVEAPAADLGLGGVEPAVDPTTGHADPAASTAAAQSRNIPYDGRFIFLRVRYRMGGRGMFRGFGREPPWQHDYPRAERNLAQILQELTFLEPYLEGGNILDLDDPDIYQYPIAYVSEPGFWDPSEEEVVALRDYMHKGGFLIFDDFGGGRDLANLEFQLSRVLPGNRLMELDLTSPIFNSFFQIENVDYYSYRGNGRPPTYYGVYEDDDPGKRLMIIANHDNDIGEFWEYSGSGWYPIDLTNEAYKLGVNYIIYAMTH